MIWLLLACDGTTKTDDSAAGTVDTAETVDTGTSPVEQCEPVMQVDTAGESTGAESGFVYCFTLDREDGTFLREAGPTVVTDRLVAIEECVPSTAYTEECQTDGDCRRNEVCGATIFGYGMNCVCYATCLSDDDCETGTACVPRAAVQGDDWSRFLHFQNLCLPAGCRSDADCGGGECRASPDSCQLGVTELACSTPADECTRDEDCTALVAQENEYCSFDGEAWVCRDYAVCG